MNKTLSNDFRQAKINKKDEFYTQLTDIEKELKYYKEYFKNKIIFCNCDDPKNSNFWNYFATNFEFLNLEETPQGYSQIVRITDQNDKLFLLKYFMKNVAGIWKISGVSIIEASDFSA